MSEQKTKHNGGRAYQCRYCLAAGKEYINEKDRVENHIWNTHLRPDQLPFYCQLCKFHCTKRDELDNHVRNYRWHAKRLFDSTGNPIPDSPSFLRENPKPYVIGLQDYIKLSKSDSDSYFAQKREAKRSSSVTGDLLTEAVQVLNKCSDDLDGNLLEDSPVQSPQAPNQGTGPLPDISTQVHVPPVPDAVTTPFEDAPPMPVASDTQFRAAPQALANPVVLPSQSLLPQGPIYVPPVLSLMQALLGTALPGHSGPSNSLTGSVSGLLGPSLVTTDPMLMETVPTSRTQEITSTHAVPCLGSTAPLDLTSASNSHNDEPLDLSTTGIGGRPEFVPCITNDLTQGPVREDISGSTTPGSASIASETPEVSRPRSEEQTGIDSKTENLSNKEGPSRIERVEEENLITQLLGEGKNAHCLL